jgi:RNA polymerase sigma-B factor
VDACAPNEERLLFARLRATGNRAARERLFRRYLPLAHRLAGRYRHGEEPIEDLRQVAGIGLLNAIDRFDPDRRTSFYAFAVPTILGELRRHFRDRTWAMRVPRALQELSLQIERARDELTGELGREPTVAELTDRLHCDEESILQALELAITRHTRPLDGEWPEDDGESLDGSGRLDDGYARAEDRAVLAPLLATLSAREAEIVFLRFSEDLTQEAIARRVGVSQMHVCRVLHRSLARLRKAAV